MPGLEDNPRLDLDDVDGLGPENINVDRPYAGSYRVAVHAFRGEARVTVRIYCGGSETMPTRTYGPTTLHGSSSSRNNDFWRIADVQITSAGGCRITDIGSAARPDIRPATDAEARR